MKNLLTHLKKSKGLLNRPVPPRAWRRVIAFYFFIFLVADISISPAPEHKAKNLFSSA